MFHSINSNTVTSPIFNSAYIYQQENDSVFNLLIDCSSAAAAAAAAESLQSCPTLCDPIDGGPLSLGFSRQEQWSGLPFPSPMHESEKRK